VVDRFVDAAGHFGHRGTPAQCLPVAAGVAEVVGEFGVGDEFGSAGRVAEFDEGSGACRHTVRGSTTPKKLPTTWAVGGAARLAAHFLAAGPACADEARRYSVAAAQESTARLGHDDAAVHYESTLRLGPNGSADIELLLALAAEPRHRTGGRRAAGRPGAGDDRPASGDGRPHRRLRRDSPRPSLTVGGVISRRCASPSPFSS
jgi:hypothetical protein